MSIEAMRQALEALETVFMPHHPAVISLRTAIAEAEKQEPVAWVDVHDYTNLYYRKPAQVDVVPLYYGPATPPAAPLQEPVAWVDEAAKVPDHVWEPPFRFRRFVAGRERAQDVVIERETTIEAAAKKAAKICPPAPMTVLVYAPNAKPRMLEPDYYVYNIDGVYRLADPQPTIRWGKK
jgi:hypothetical protein